MEEATKLHAGKMAAIIGMEKEKVVEICRRTGAEVANFNSPAQIVITGHAARVEAACEVFRQEGAKSVIPLDVSGAFHSSLMQSAADKFRGELQKISLNKPSMAVAANVNGQPADDPAVILKNLSNQITSSVQWVDTVTNIAKAGVTTFLEIGPGSVLKGLIRRIDKNLTVHNIEVPADIDALPF
jgi:[acyl-carrier-protein] S-malonyltransferase